MPRETDPPPARRKVLIFRHELLSYSETFIRTQAEHFQTFTPIYTGRRRIKGLDLPAERTVVPENGGRAGASEFQSRLRELSPALIHAHFEDGGLQAQRLARDLNIPLVVTCHGYDVTQTPSGWRNWPVIATLRRRRRLALLPKFSLCIGISRFICDQMLRRGYPADKVRLHYIGVDVDRFRPDPTVAKQPVILFIGRLVEKKGPRDLLEAMRTVNATHPEVRVKLCGTGPLLESLQAYAREHRINAEFCGVQPSAAIQRMLPSSLMLCLPSVRAASGDSEGLPIVVMEAQAVGLPVVATQHAGIPEAIEHGVTGLLAPERDPQTLAAHILALLGDTALREKMGAAGRERMVQHFNLARQSAELEKIYLELL